MSAEKITVEPDLYFENHGSVVLITPLSRWGESFLDENVDAPNYCLFGSAIAADWRCAAAILHGAVEHGLRLVQR